MQLLRLDDVKDVHSRNKILLLHPEYRQSAIDAFLLATLNMCGKNMLRITHSLRTPKEQNDLWQKGRDSNGKKVGNIVTNAKAFQSYHNYGIAIDFCLIHPDGKASWSLKEDLDADGISDWREVANAFKYHGWEWGGEWQGFIDNPHCQIIPASILAEANKQKVRPWKVLQNLYIAQGVKEKEYVSFNIAA